MDNLLKMMEPRMVDASTTAQTLNFGPKLVYDGNLYVGADFRNELVEGITDFFDGSNDR
jgi:hypothetical protein